ncbi:MAG: OmpA family protein, partial [Myxococcota bacterium]|nr:OmpA family protein [Myxococcota bacterium]
MKPVIRLFMACLCLTYHPSVHAQSNVRRFSASPVQSPYLTIEGARSLGSGQIATGALSIFEKRSLILVDDDERTGDLLDNRLLVDASFAYGVLDWLDVGLVLPIAMGQTGLTSHSQEDVATFALGDPRIGVKFSLLPKTQRTIALGIIADSWVPVGDPEAYAGEDGWGGRVTLAADVRLPKRITLAFNAGYKMRPESELAGAVIDDELALGAGAQWRLSKVDLVGELNTATGASQPFGQDHLNAGEFDIGARFHLPRRQKLVGGMGMGLLPGLGTPTWRIFVGYGIDASTGRSMVAATPQAPTPTTSTVRTPPDAKRVNPENDSPPPKEPRPTKPTISATALLAKHEDADGDGLSNHVDACPHLPEDRDDFRDEDGCPDPDNDLDKVPDITDQAPNSPEDWDAFEDSDGRPDPDNDQDGVPDVQDRCPLEAGFGDGCPTSPMNWQAAVIQPDFQMTGGPTLLGGTIYAGPKLRFEPQSDQFAPGADTSIATVARLLRERPDFLKIEVGVHVKTEHGPKWDQWLANERAERLTDALTERGVDPKRLFPVGYGSSARQWTTLFGKQSDHYSIELRILAPFADPPKRKVIKRPKTAPPQI